MVLGVIGGAIDCVPADDKQMDSSPMAEPLVEQRTERTIDGVDAEFAALRQRP